MDPSRHASRLHVQNTNERSPKGTVVLSTERTGSHGDLRHLMVLEELQHQANVSQRMLGERLGLAPSLVNGLIHELLDGGHLEVVNRSVRPYAYRLTPLGRQYRRRLSHQHFELVVMSFRRLQDRIRRRLREIREDGVERLAFYGSGDVMEVTAPLAEALGLTVVGVVDDDREKQGTERCGHVVQCPTTLGDLEPEGVLITTVRHAGGIQERIDPDLRKRMRVLEL